MSSEKKRIRIDMLIQEINVIDEKKGIFGFSAVPDPRVWEKTDINGEKGYLHKLNGMFLSDKELANAIPSLKGKPI